MKEIKIIVKIATGPPTEEQKRLERQDSYFFGQFLMEALNKRKEKHDSENHGKQRAGLQAGEAG